MKSLGEMIVTLVFGLMNLYLIVNRLRAGSKILALKRAAGASMLFVGGGFLIVINFSFIISSLVKYMGGGSSNLTVRDWRLMAMYTAMGSYYTLFGWSTQLLCEKGILVCEIYIPWSRIKSVIWSPTNKNILVIDYDRTVWSKFIIAWSRPSIEVSDSNREEVVNLIKQKVPAVRDTLI